MVQFFDLPRNKSTGEKLMQGLGLASQAIPELISGYHQQKQSQAQNQALENIPGLQGIGQLAPDMQKLLAPLLLKQQQQQLDTGPNPAISALDSLEKMVGQTGIGTSGFLNPSSEARYNRGKFESLQAAILPLFKSMFPRGMTEKEFKFIQDKYIPQASDTEQKIKGKIAGLRQLVASPESTQSLLSPQAASSGKTLSFKDAKGQFYDIPEEVSQSPEFAEQAKQLGLMPE